MFVTMKWVDIILQVNPTSTGATRFGHYYDLTKVMDKTVLDSVDTTLVDVSTETHCHR